ncbi:unnamed protein product [Meganyctiphanes norvegica]|uniref:Alpha-1,3-mannosyl-glycoprotein 2-beta-N-acetylglucosaminyltransferase n=1 Tax=Meganyctiphanes norvegica TaxID=48144 RepID=A0AAV2RPM9_MEGNR
MCGVIMLARNLQVFLSGAVVASTMAFKTTGETAIMTTTTEDDNTDDDMYFSISGLSSTSAASLNVSLPGVPEIFSWQSIDESETLNLTEHDGLVMSVFHEDTGEILLTRTFQTWSAYAHAQDLVWWLGRVQTGRLVVLMIKQGGTYGLEAAYPTLRKLGSLLVGHTPPRALWIWIFVNGGQTISETLHPVTLWWVKPPTRPPISLYTHGIYVKKVNEENTNPEDLRVVKNYFCEKHGAMGKICDISTTQVSPLHAVEKESEFGVVISAGGRVQYLANAIEHLLLCPELTINNIVVALSIDFKSGIPNPSAISLLKSYGIRYSIVNTPDIPSINHRLFQFYRGVWRVALATFPLSKYLVFLDEDVSVSKTWMYTLLHAAPTLDVDSSLWCISGTGAAHPDIFHDPKVLLRADKQAGWGFLVRADDVHMAVESWPDDSNVSVLYDTYLHFEVGQGRECIYPSMARARHYGVGINTIGYLHQRYFLDLPLYDGPPVQLTPINQLIKDSYEMRIDTRIKSATPITQDPCTKDFLQILFPGSSSQDYILYFILSSTKTVAWTMLAECLGAWPYNLDGHHNWMWELPQSWGGSLFLVGVPASPYSRYRPKGYTIWPPNNEDSFFDKQERFSQSLYPKPVVRTGDGIYSDLFKLNDKTVFNQTNNVNILQLQSQLDASFLV